MALDESFEVARLHVADAASVNVSRRYESIGYELPQPLGGVWVDFIVIVHLDFGCTSLALTGRDFPSRPMWNSVKRIRPLASRLKMICLDSRRQPTVESGEVCQPSSVPAPPAASTVPPARAIHESAILDGRDMGR